MTTTLSAPTILARPGLAEPAVHLNEAVGLTERRDDPVRAYSLGMKHRLGIAAALLPEPDLLVLDEPTNGLDPAGIREMRGLLRAVADEGVTVFVSSHLLSEIEAICDHLVLIQDGRLRFAGTTGELLAGQRTRVVATPEDADDLPRLVGLARTLGLDGGEHSDGVRFDGDHRQAARLNRAAARDGITLAQLRTERPSLEDAFFAVTDSPDGHEAVA